MGRVSCAFSKLITKCRTMPNMRWWSIWCRTADNGTDQFTMWLLTRGSCTVRARDDHVRVQPRRPVRQRTQVGEAPFLGELAR